MYYFAGIYSCGSYPVDTKLMQSMLERGENCIFITDSRLASGIRLPDEKMGLLSVPEFSHSEKDNIMVLFEGRLKNKCELMARLPECLREPAFSDSELIRALYGIHSFQFLSNLKGTFVFVLWDKNKNRLFLCRDPVGTKSLYYILSNGFLIFATTMQPILMNPVVKKEMNLERIFNYFILDGLNFGDATEYKGIKSIVPGECLIVSAETIRSRHLFSFDHYNLNYVSEQQIVKQFGKTIQDAVEYCVSNKEKMAIAFSGGVDTNTILSICAKKQNMRIDTYTLKFESFSKVKALDYTMAQERAQEFHTKHHESIIGPELFLNEIREMTSAIDRLVTFEHMNNVFILKWIAKSSGFAITGDGTEEQLGSYRYTWPAYYADQYLRAAPDINFFTLNGFLRDILFQRTGWREGSKKAMQLFTPPIYALFKDYEIAEIRDTCIANSINTNLIKEEDGFIPSVLNKCFWIDFFYFFCPNKLLVFDLISRNLALDVYMPFVDQDFVAFSFSVPVELKCKGFAKRKTKYIFRAAVADLIGRENAFREFKSGSDIPYNEWLLDKEFEKYIRDVLRPSRIKMSGILNETYVKRIIDAHYSNKQLFTSPYTHILHKKGVNYRSDILKLLAFQIWWENNFS